MIKLRLAVYLPSKCTHVAISSPGGGSPYTPGSDVHEPITPGSDHMFGMDFSQDAGVKEYGFEDMVNSDLDFDLMYRSLQKVSSTWLTTPQF